MVRELFEIYEQESTEDAIPIPEVHVPNWFFSWQGPTGVAVASLAPFVVAELHRRGVWNDNETLLPWIVVVLMLAWAAVVLAHTGPVIKRQFLKRRKFGRQMIGGSCFACAAAFVVALFVVFNAVRALRIEQKAEARAAEMSAPPAPGTPGGTTAPLGEPPKPPFDVDLGDPSMQRRRAEQAENEARDERAKRQELQIQQLQQQVATLTARAAAAPTPQAPSQPSGATRPGAAPAPAASSAAAPSVGQFLVDLAPATGSCSAIGTSTYRGRDGSETNLLNNAGAAEEEFKGYVDRIVAGANNKEPTSEGRARDRLSSWMRERVNEVDGAFGGNAALDFERTPASDEIVDKYRSVPLSNGSIELIRNATGVLACYRTVRGNIQARRPAAK